MRLEMTARFWIRFTVYCIKRQVTTLQRNLNFGWWRQSLDQAFNAIKFMIWRSDFTQESVLHGTKIFVRYRLSDKIENSRNYKITIFRTDSNLIGKVYYQYNSTVRFTKGIKYIIPGIQSVRCLSGFFVFFIICTFMLQAACLSRVHLHAISRNVNIASRNDVVFKIFNTNNAKGYKNFVQRKKLMPTVCNNW